jgi:hypothetical protein
MKKKLTVLLFLPMIGFGQTNTYERNSSSFKFFINAFTNDCLSLTNFHESYSKFFSKISLYSNSKFGKRNYFNSGFLCNFYLGSGSIIFPNRDCDYPFLMQETTIYHDKFDRRFCELSAQPDGLYYNTFSRPPSFADSNEIAESIYKTYKEYNKCNNI